MARTGTELGERGLPRLAWSAIVAGVLLALAAHVVLGLIGAALGLAASPADSEAIGAGAAIWGLLTPLVATLVGAWLAVRLAGAWDGAAANLHGVMVWAIGLLAGALFLAGTLATGALSAGTAASGNAGALQRLTGTAPAEARGPAAEAGAERAARNAAATAGAGAMASLCGLLGAFAGAALARRRGDGKGLGFRIAIQRTQAREREAGQRLEAGRAQGERTYVPPLTRDEPARDVARSEVPGASPPSDPYHH